MSIYKKLLAALCLSLSAVGAYAADYQVTIHCQAGYLCQFDVWSAYISADGQHHFKTQKVTSFPAGATRSVTVNVPAGASTPTIDVDFKSPLGGDAAFETVRFNDEVPNHNAVFIGKMWGGFANRSACVTLNGIGCFS